MKPFDIKNKKGLTLLELVLVIGVSTGVIVVAGVFVNNVVSTSPYFEEELEIEQELRSTLSEVVSEIRAISYSNVGNYPIESANGTSLTFFSDTDKNGIFERIRYFLEENTLKKGVVVPSGTPLVYNPANEVIKEVAQNIVSGYNIFSYFDNSFTGVEAPMIEPVIVASIRMVEVTLTADRPRVDSPGPITLSMRSTIRNLRDNL